MLSYEVPSSGSLSINDDRVLAQLFDPEGAAAAPSLLIDDNLPVDQSITSAQELANLQDREACAIRITESSTSDHEEAYLRALSILDEIVQTHPRYASAYNNRAQLRRWHLGSNANLTGPAAHQTFLALTDLQTAISLATPPSSLAQTQISSTRAKILAQAWTQLGAIHWATAKSLQNIGLDRIPSIQDADVDWYDWDHIRFEEEGSRCFFMAGMYGGKVGRGMAVVANPHARLCGNIVKEAMRGEVNGKSQGSAAQANCRQSSVVNEESE